jgi:hypothetical protein
MMWYIIIVNEIISMGGDEADFYGGLSGLQQPEVDDDHCSIN